MPDELTRHGAHVMTVCNACRYCEHYCPVFPAIEQTAVFDRANLAYLSNLCHNCGECLYACQYAPPHEFGIDVPKTLAQLRHRSYDEYAWPRAVAAAFRRQGSWSALIVAGALTAILFTAVLLVNPEALRQPAGDADFYRVVPHSVMVTLFGVVGLAAACVLTVGTIRCWRDLGVGAWPPAGAPLRHALRDALTLRHLHAAGADCVSGEERRAPWRRWCHHCTFYGFLRCFASTSVAAVYHASGSVAPHAYTSLPVLLGTAGGAGLVIGPAGLWLLRRRRDRDLMDDERAGLDESFLLLLLLTSVTGLLLMVLRERAVMGLLLVVHLGAVLALMITLPYGKFVHGLYRTLALLKYARESLHRR